MKATKQEQLIKATIPVLKQHCVTLTSRYLKRMSIHNPELKNTFNAGNQKIINQQKAFAMSVLAYALHMDDPLTVEYNARKIRYTYLSQCIPAEQYAIAGQNLIASISEVLGDAATPEIIEAWSATFSQLAGILIRVKANLYKSSIGNKGEWRSFVIKRKIRESEEIISFYLYPADSEKVDDFLPGQYVSIRLLLPDLTLSQPRQYSLSNAPNGTYYRISVKIETGKNSHPNGMLSNHLHHFNKEGDIIEVASPDGNFTLNTMKENPVVFISGGVGQTPLISMVEYLINSRSGRKIVWIHGSWNKAVHAFDKLIAEIASRHSAFKKYIFYDLVEEQTANEQYYKGIVDLGKLKDEIILHNADYYVCGPELFVKKQFHDLTEMGVKEEAMHCEEFTQARRSC